MTSAYCVNDIRMKEYRLEQLKLNPDFKFKKLDVSDRQIIQQLESFEPFDAVFNLAARAGVRAALENPWEYVNTNTTGTLNMLEFCRRTNVPKFILASTSSIYGLNAPLPTPESAASDQPLQPYAARSETTQ